MTAYARGHVVALRRAGLGVVWTARDGDVWLLPIWGKNGPPRHRAEVQIDDLSDIAACGLSLRYPVVRCNTLQRVRASQIVGLEPIGLTPAVLLARIVASVTREAKAQEMESRLQFMNPAIGADEMCVRF
jgi:hypothetical protein